MAENYGSLEGTLDAHDILEGEMNNHSDLTGEIQFSGGVGGVKDVQVNNESVVDANKVAHIDLTPYAEKEDVYDKQTIDTALEGKADTDDIPTELSDLQDDADHRTVTDAEKTEWSGKSNVSANPSTTTETLTGIEIDGTAYAIPSGGSGDVADVKVNGTSVVDPVTKEAEIDLSGYAETSDIPTDLADLSDDATHRLVTDTEKSTWDNKADVSDIPTVNNNTITIQKNGQNIDSFTLNQNSNKAINISVPTKTSDLQNDSSFITNTVNNLANYYLKSDTYTQTEVNNLISAAVNGRFEKVTTLPASGEPNVIYLVPKTTALTNNVYDEYIWQDNAWELLGSTEIDLSNYVTTTDLSTALADYVTSSTFNTTISNYYTKTEVGNLLDGKVDKINGKGLSTNDYDNTAKGIVDGVTNALAGKVDKVNGKGLSTEDYTTNEKNKLSGIASGAEVNVQSDWTQTNTSADDYIKNKPIKVSDFTNDSGFTKVESSTTNGNIKIDSVETPVYRNYGNNAVLQTDKTPFLTRQILNPTEFSGYVREKLVGASYAWNQLVQNGNFADTSNWITNYCSFTVSGNVATVTPTNTTSYIGATIPIIKGHNYLRYAQIKCSEGKGRISWYGAVVKDETMTGNWVTVCDIYNNTYNDNNSWQIQYGVTQNSGLSSYQIRNAMIIDLTLAFGSTIADYLYGLSNNGGITKLRDMGCPIDKYTAYGNYLVSSKTSGKKIICGFNLFDEEFELGELNAQGQEATSTTKIRSKNYIRLLDGTTYYYFKSSSTAWLCFYDSGKNFISAISQGADSVITKPSNAVYCRFNFPTTYGTAYKNDTCINVSTTTGSPKNGDYVPSQVVTYSLGNDELRGKFDVVNGEIVASGDVKESNGEITRNRKHIELNSINYTYNSTNAYFYTGDITDRKYGNNILCLSSHYTDVGDKSASDMASVANMSMASNNNNVQIKFKNTAYTDATAFKNAMAGVYLEYDLATPTTEQSTPFADPMSLVGATTEEYIDTRDIPCPVGAERQYMGQSEDIVKIPPNPQSDGKRKLVAETSGGKTQYYFENDSDKPKRTMIVNLESYSSHSNKYEAPCDGYAMIMVYAGTGLVVMEVSDCNGVTLAMQSVGNPPTTSYISSFMKKGMKFHYTNNDGLSVSPAFRGIT